MAPSEFAAWGIGAFLAGILLAGTHSPPAYFLGLAVLGSGSAWLIGRRTGAVILVIAAIFTGAFYYRLFFNFETLSRNLRTDGSSYLAVVSGEPRLNKNSVSAELKLKPPQAGRVQGIFPAGSVLRYGDEVKISGRMEPPQSERNLPVLLARNFEISGTGKGNPVFRSLLVIKAYFLSPVRLNLPSGEGAFLEGILLGYKNDFSEMLRSAMQRSGTTHLVALSGYNITILIVALHAALIGRIRRRAAFFVAAIGIILFALMTGAEPSIIRASIMGILLLLAYELGRIPNYGLMTIWAAFFMCVWDPGAMFTAGFVLSFASFLGIGYLSPAISAAFHLSEAADGAVMIMSAQLATLPFLLMFFGQITWISLLTNLLILPVVPALMGLGFAFMGLSFVLPVLAPLFAWLVRAPLEYILGVIRISANMSSPLNFNMPLWLALAYIAGLSAFSLHYGKRKAN